MGASRVEPLADALGGAVWGWFALGTEGIPVSAQSAVSLGVSFTTSMIKIGEEGGSDACKTIGSGFGFFFSNKG